MPEALPKQRSVQSESQEVEEVWNGPLENNDVRLSISLDSADDESESVFSRDPKLAWVRRENTVDSNRRDRHCSNRLERLPAGRISL